jgi:EpsD family peptidyl-prolyl cis-trans isomerase
MLLAALLAIAVSACGNGKGEKVATQVAAKVDGEEITVHQINAVLARTPGIGSANAAQAKKEILDKLIDQQLAVRQAEEQRLDRSPNVVQALEAARREILARAYLEQLVANQPKPQPEEVKKYYADHPELFAQRRILNLQELVIPNAASMVEEVRRWVVQGRSMQEMANSLRSQQVVFVANTVSRPAEQLPLESLSRFQTLKDGETLLLEGPQGLMVEHLVSSQSSPIDEAAASPRIEMYLVARRNAESVAREIKTLRDKAKIDHMGEFASGAAPAVNLDKGVAGLK